ncbi:AAA family ATPase [Allorhizobium taibaishanense]|uniref:AAA+ ATPase domain-containing protein n=1 Tax=Allorhizobium taibaishanense TaxID=887144 RepID=A0A1Q8ZZK4_9HYPH|nr:ATP-binding protein [Allorhizobium taibaishanense]MBB4007229.1 hypothetical protein [Allorhizobium taibaishanense]OLP47765.1 hypothetical protein BJF91_05205 [Allorhizobium taibaishanense]
MADWQHIKDLQIEAFRGLRRVELYDCEQVNLIVGGNNSGKTSILEALGVFASPFDLTEWATIARLREVRSPVISSESSLTAVDAMRWLFPAGEELPLALSGRGGWIARNLDAYCTMFRGIPPEPRYRDDRRNKIPSDIEEIGWHVEVGIDLWEHPKQSSLFDHDDNSYRYAVDLWPSTGFVQRGKNNPKLRTVMLGPYSHRNQPLQMRAISNSITEGDKWQIVELLRGIDENILNLEIITSPPYDRPTVVVRHRDAGLLPISVLGDGFRRALSIALALSAARNGLLLIDEVETAFHISVLDKVFRWMIDLSQELNVQVFATTHSLEAIQAITSVELSRKLPVAAFHIDRPLSDDANVKRYGSEMLRRVVRDRGFDIR